MPVFCLKLTFFYVMNKFQGKIRSIKTYKQWKKALIQNNREFKVMTTNCTQLPEIYHLGEYI